MNLDECVEGLATRATETDRAGALPRRNWDDLAASGYLDLLRPGADGRAMGIAMEQVARACASSFWTVTLSGLLVGRLLHTLGGRQVWLDRILSGEKIGAFAATEDGPGSDPGSYRTTVSRRDGRLWLNGVKSRISNATTADVAFVLARPEDPFCSRLCYAIVDLRRPNITRTDDPTLGLRGMSWGRIRFEDVEIPEEDVIFDADVPRTMQAVEWGQLIQAWCGIGIARRALEATIAYSRERVVFGRPIAEFELIRGRVADLHAQVEAAHLLALDATVRKASGQPARELVMIAKIYGSDLAVRAADAAMRTFGGWGYGSGHLVERLYRDSLGNVPAGLPNDRLRELLACGSLGVDAWSHPEG